MTTIYQLLDQFRATSKTKREKGDKLEHLILAYLKTDPLYVSKYSNVWLWMDWPGRDGKGDTGIDLVAEERETKDLCAIQCKFYDPDHTLDKPDIDSFFTASGKSDFTSRLIVSTTDHWSKHAEDALKDQKHPVTRLRVQDLDESPVDWADFSPVQTGPLKTKPKKQLRPHQKLALSKVDEGFGTADRGKLIMACGTGKTFASLKIAEHLTPIGGSVLFLVPSISLLSQSLKEWSSEASTTLRMFAVCSDIKVGKRTEHEDIGSYDLAFPATTKPEKLHLLATADHQTDALTVVFSTYQSIGVISEAQVMGLPEFDLIICDEAHRTTGVTLAEEDETNFQLVHDQQFLKGKKRLYMTATPRIFDDPTKALALQAEAVLTSMDNEAIYGPEFHRLGFGDAVGAGLLSDYKVLVLAVDEGYVSKVFQNQLANNSELKLEDAAKLVGCWNGLSKRKVSKETFELDPDPMHRAVAFSRSIKGSKRITDMFASIVERLAELGGEDDALSCEVDHVDGTFNALLRNEKLDWLKATPPDPEGVCRILSNARCLSEGVDIPALDAVLFLNPRNSVVDVVQSVGRVMRRAEGKSYGYVILPVGVPANMTPEEALKDNNRYKVVWQVLQALRAHDERFNALVNKIDLNKQKPDQLQVIGIGGGDDPDGKLPGPTAVQGMLTFPNIEQLRDAIYAKIVQKVGNRLYWETWAHDVSLIAERHTQRIQDLLDNPELNVRKYFERFLKALQQNLNDSVSEQDAINMLSQHLITKPVFDALFETSTFASSNPVSIVMQRMIDRLEKESLDTEAESLESFYASVRDRAKDIDNAEGKQQIIVELYEKFFKLAFPKVADSLGIVYTPVEIVDFIVKSVESVLNTELSASMNDDKVHVLDPFTGTGTFIARLLQSGIIKPERLAHKYANELHANEIILLAYYIAAINIEASYERAVGGKYVPFEGVVLTDTFQMFESGDSMDDVFFPQNSERVQKQKHAEIRVVIANPPYSVGQGSQNDANQNLTYRTLDSRIEATYAAQSTATLKRNLYDSYVRAFRWASDRIKDKGIVGFVSNGAYIDTASFDGFRKSLASEFSAVYCFNLRGNQRTAGETSRKEGGKVFGGGSRTPIAITLLVKDSTKTGPCKIYYHDIGDYLSREAKLAMIAEFGDIDGVAWETIKPNSAGDWVNQRNPEFQAFAPLGDKDGKEPEAMFSTYSLGVVTGRDAWAYNFSHSHVATSMSHLAAFYNRQVDDFQSLIGTTPEKATKEAVDDFIDLDPHKISWTRGLKNGVRLGKHVEFDRERIVQSMYRPFCKQWLYFDRQLNEMVLLVPKLFPTRAHDNLVISMNASDSRKPFGALMTNLVPNLALSDPGQCFPLYYYEEVADEGGLLGSGEKPAEMFQRRHSITDATLERYQKQYSDKVDKDDIFYYVYGLLHSPEYRVRFSSDLRKMIPRIPLAPDFWAFSKAGRDLAEWHLNYETVKPYPLDGLDASGLNDHQLKVIKMHFPKAGKVADKTKIVFNSQITLSGIPEEAYQYELHSKSAIEWLIDRFEMKKDPASGIVNDPNTWSDDPRYVLDLIARMVTVSLETVRIVQSLPSLD